MSFIDLAKGHLDMKIKTWPFSILYVSFQVQGNENASTYNAGHMTKLAAMYIYSKTLLKIFFPGTGGPIYMKLGM